MIVWEFLADPQNRASAISVVESFEVEGETTVWHLEVPLPGSRRTVAVHTRTVEREPPDFVRFEGESSVFDVSGEHRIERTASETTVHNRFDVTGHVPGVETVFRGRFGAEIENLEAAIERWGRDR